MEGEKKDLDKAVEQTFKIQCKGRGFLQSLMLSEPVSVDVTVRQTSDTTLGLFNNCPYLGDEPLYKCLVYNNPPYRGFCPYHSVLPNHIDNSLRNVRM